MCAVRSAQEPRDLIPTLIGGLERLELPSGPLAASFPGEVLADTLGNLRRRLDEGPAAAVRIAFFGPTGVGKSKIFNSIAGGNPSPSGYRRPFTMRSVYLLHEARRGLTGGLRGDVKPLAIDAWKDLVLMDTPDFDSVERGNRAEAERVFREVDAFIFITDVQKYADHSTWEYLDRVFREGKPAVIVLNKVTGDGPVADFFSRIEARLGRDGAAAERVVVGEHPVDDRTPIPESEPGLERLRQALSSLQGTADTRRVLLERRFKADLDAFFGLWDRSAASLRPCLDALAALEQRLRARCEAAGGDLRVELRTALDPGLKAEVYSRVVERLQKIDILRYPRRLLALPLEGIKTVLGKWIGRRPTTAEAIDDDPSRSETFQILESRLIRLYEETREDFRRQDRCPGILREDDLQALRIAHEPLSAMYREREAVFSEWLKREARETASALTGENKVKFILSQVIYNSVVVGVQIHTAGGFTLAELLTDSVLSPLVAKAVTIAVSSEKVARFEKMAQDEHHRLLVEIIEEFRSRIAGYLEKQGSWKPAFEGLEAGIASFRAAREDLLAAFSGGSR